MTDIVIILCLISLNGVFAMAEIAMISVRKSQLETAANKKDKSAKMVLTLMQNPSKFLSTVQIGITLIGLLTGIYSGELIVHDVENYVSQFPLFKAYAQTISIVVVVTILTFLSLVLGELIPKRIGLAMPEKVSKLLAFPMYVTYLFTAPFTWILSLTTDFMVKLLRIKNQSNSNVTEEEIKAIIRDATTSGEVQAIEHNIVENVFHLGDRKINTLMTPRYEIDWLDINEDISVTKQKIINSKHEMFPACLSKLDNVSGIVRSKDILKSLLLNQPFALKEHVKPVLFFSEVTTAYAALEKFKEHKKDIAMVVDEFGGIEGILTMNDLVDSLLTDFVNQLHEEQEIVPRDDGSFIVDASLPLPEFARYFNIAIMHDNTLNKINTLGGLAYNVAKEIPRTGFKFEWKGLVLEIVDMDGRRIDKFLITKLPNAEEFEEE